MPHLDKNSRLRAHAEVAVPQLHFLRRRDKRRRLAIGVQRQRRCTKQQRRNETHDSLIHSDPWLPQTNIVPATRPDIVMICMLSCDMDFTFLRGVTTPKWRIYQGKAKVSIHGFPL